MEHIIIKAWQKINKTIMREIGKQIKIKYKKVCINKPYVICT